MKYLFDIHCEERPLHLKWSLINTMSTSLLLSLSSQTQVIDSANKVMSYAKIAIKHDSIILLMLMHFQMFGILNCMIAHR